MKGYFIAGVLVGALLAVSARGGEASAGVAPAMAMAIAQPEQGTSAGAKAAPAKAEDGSAGVKAGGVTNVSAVVGEILRMQEAGVSTEVIKTYIESYPTACDLSATDLVALRKHGVPDELAVALVKREATLREQANEAKNSATVPQARLRRPSFNGTLDPESYAYFQYYYLYPRTLAAANQRLFTPYPPSPSFPLYTYGYYGRLPFHPFPPSALRRP